MTGYISGIAGWSLFPNN